MRQTTITAVKELIFELIDTYEDLTQENISDFYYWIDGLSEEEFNKVAGITSL